MCVYALSENLKSVYEHCKESMFNRQTDTNKETTQTFTHILNIYTNMKVHGSTWKYMCTYSITIVQYIHNYYCYILLLLLLLLL